jgi:hypothetical protein
MEATETTKTYRVVGALGYREKVVAEGISREEAHAMREKMLADPLCRGFSVWVEEEPSAEEAARERELRAWHAGLRR